MKTVSDVIVAGGGPSGSFTALSLAKHGVNVDVFEEHNEIGLPSHCPGHLSINGLKSLGLYPLPSGIVENTFYGAVFHSPKGKGFTVRLFNPVTCSVNRSLFDKHLAEMAEKAGAQYHLDSRVESPIVESGFVRGVIVKQRGETGKVFAKIVVDAEGVSSRILRQAGLPSLNRGMLVNGVQAEVERVKDIEPNMVEVFLGNEYAPGFYAWLIPSKDGEKAKVGLATKTGNPKLLLQRFMLKHPVASKKLRIARILHAAFHPIPLGGPIPKACSNGFLAVGDAASQVKPTTGGGVIFGLTCARVAAEVAYEALRSNDLSEKFLSAYQRQCRALLGFDVNMMLKIRKTLDAMTDEQFDEIIGFCTRLNLAKPLQSVEDIDFQGRSLLHLLRSPRMLTALFYFFLVYLSANP